MSLANQRVVVLGGTSGIGLATADLAARQGAEVVVASSNPRSVERALSALPGGVKGDVADLTDPAQVSALFGRIGPFDHLVFTAGEPLVLMPLDALDLGAAMDFFTLRYFGALSAVTAALRHLREGGSVVLTTGIAGDRPSPGWVVAASILGAVESMVRGMAVELAPLRVNAVSPGVVRSPLWAALDDDAREEMYAGTGASLLLGRVGEVEDIAEAYVFLMRERWATGTIVTVDGGALLV
ncbi:SDR family oxidoreductase [Microbispora sp. NPDC049125]|uniref:SDR family oxidoreductase n=1 Tax=Microbispora sp. NPDC049125 TaxID=3154929 RepID=UPI0034678683